MHVQYEPQGRNERRADFNPAWRHRQTRSTWRSDSTLNRFRRGMPPPASPVHHSPSLGLSIEPGRRMPVMAPLVTIGLAMRLRSSHLARCSNAGREVCMAQIFCAHEICWSSHLYCLSDRVANELWECNEGW